MIQETLNKAMSNGFSQSWQVHTLASIFEGGKKEEKNYETIMISSLMPNVFGKLYGISKLSRLEPPLRLVSDPHIPLWITKAITRGGQGQHKSAYCCFVDIKKAFDIVPTQKLWERWLKSL